MWRVTDQETFPELSQNINYMQSALLLISRISFFLESNNLSSMDTILQKDRILKSYSDMET